MTSYIWDINRGNKKEEAIFSPLSGDDPEFDPNLWNDRKKIRKTHNCYAYVFDIINENFDRKPQPGYYSGYDHMTDDDLRSCDKLMERIKGDNPSVIRSSFHKKCPKGYRKGYIAVDTSDNPDYHFYRLNKDGTWSHKPGSTRARLENFDGKIITRPDKAKRQSESHYYDRSCGYFCFNPKEGNISNKPRVKGGGKKGGKKSL